MLPSPKLLAVLLAVVGLSTAVYSPAYPAYGGGYAAGYGVS